jgi:NADH:ubiquinone oxidoreductase subunit K
MELFSDGLQLVGFLAVTVAILASLVAVAIGITVFLYMADRKIEIDQRERYHREPNVPAEAQS